MSLKSFISKQFIDVIQWLEEEPGVLAYRYPMQDQEIQNGGQLIVRETQRAVFINEGKFADVFGPGTYTLNTNTLPVLTYLKNWDKLFESPFKSDVYFFSQREQLDQKWGTPQPITFRDKEFGPLRIRAFGNYSFKMMDVDPFWKKLVGTADIYRVSDIEGQLRAAIITAISSFLAKSDIPFLDMAGNQDLFSQKLLETMAPVFQTYGLALQSFFVQNLSLPEALQEHLDKVSSMRMIGDLQKYTQFQTAEAITKAAENPGGEAGAGIGLGAGLAMGQAMAQNLAGAMTTQNNTVNPGIDPIQMLEKLGDLFKKGILTQEEFDRKKTEILNQIK